MDNWFGRWNRKSYDISNEMGTAYFGNHVLGQGDEVCSSTVYQVVIFSTCIMQTTFSFQRISIFLCVYVNTLAACHFELAFHLCTVSEWRYIR